MKTSCLALTVSLAFFARLGAAHVPVPDSVLHPATAPEAWNVLRLAGDNLDRLLAENRLAEIPDQASLCSPALRVLPPQAAAAATPETRRAVTGAAVKASITVTTLAQAAVAGDRDLAKSSLDTLHANLKDLAAFFDPAATRADIYLCPMHPDVVSADAAIPCSKCGMHLAVRRIPYSFVYTPPGEPTLRLTAIVEPPQVKVRLAHGDGAPVLLSELEVVHTQPIHLLIIDPSLGDYHHEHPVATDTPGEYAFSFAPADSRPYRIYADLVPTATGVQEYPFCDLSGRTDSPSSVDKTNRDTAESGDLKFRLEFANGANSLRANQAQELYVTVSTRDNQPMAKLEPVMAAFAHLVGFYDDNRTVVHLHPEGAEASDPNGRGGPVLCFRFYPPKPGFLRLYCQVQVNGQQIFAPFGVTVAP